jgi:hypothetical protein
MRILHHFSIAILLFCGTNTFSSVFPGMPFIHGKHRQAECTVALGKTRQLPAGVESNAEILYFAVNLPRDIQDLKMPSGPQQVVTLFEELSDEGGWQPTSKEIMPFDADGYPAGKRVYRMSDEWWLSQEMTGTLQSGGRLTELIYTEYEENGSSGGMSISYAWDGERIIAAQVAFVDETTGEMVADYSYEYTADGHLERLRGSVNILETEMDMFDAGFTYSDGRLVEIDIVEPLVESRTREQYAYDDANNTITVTAQTLNGDTWDNDVRTVYAFDHNGRVLSETEQYISENVWANNWKLERYWGSSAAFFDSTYGYRPAGQDEWELAERISNTVSETSVARPANMLNASGHSPLIVHCGEAGAIHVDFRISDATYAGMALYDCRGGLCATLFPFSPMNAGEYRLAWPAPGGAVPLSPGRYVCVLKTETGILSRAVTIAR